MPTICGCNKSLRNTGTPDDQKLISVGVIPILVPLRDAQGNRNQIIASDTLDKAFFDQKFHNPDAKGRWFPLGEVVNATDERGEPEYEEFNDNSRSLLQEARREATAVFRQYGATFVGIINSFYCKHFGLYVVDECGNLIGERCEEDGTVYLRPIPVNGSTWYGRLMKATPEAVQKVMLSYDFHRLAKDENLRQITAEEIGGYDLLSARGLLDVDTTLSAVTATSATVSLVYNYQSVFETDPVEGLDLADFRFYNKTTGAEIIPDSVTESPAGVYVFSFTAGITAGDEIEVTQSGTSTSYFGIYDSEVAA